MKARLLHVVPDLGTGGAERLVVDLAYAANKERFEVNIVSLFPEKGTLLESEATRNGLRIFFLKKRLGLDLQVISQLYYLLRDFKPDILHTHRYVLRYVLLPTLLCNIPVRIHTVHNVAQKEVDRPGKLVNWFAFHIGGFIPVSISQEIANTVHAVYGRNIHTPVVYNGIFTRRFIFDVKQEASKEDKNVIVLHVGRFSPQKNHLLLLEAFAFVVKKFPAIQLWLVGDGPLRASVERKVLSLGLQEKVSFLGVRDDVPELLARSDMLVLSSDYEGVPLIVLEAMAAARPVVATAVGGVPELIDDGVTGILVPSNNSKALAEGILTLAKDGDLRRRMGKKGRNCALNRFDITSTAREYEALYLKFLKARQI